MARPRPPHFQKLLDCPGPVGPEAIASLAHLGALMSSKRNLRTALDAESAGAKAKSAYRDFFCSRKMQHPIISTLKEAKSEYANLQ